MSVRTSATTDARCFQHSDKLTCSSGLSSSEEQVRYLTAHQGNKATHDSSNVAAISNRMETIRELAVKAAMNGQSVTIDLKSRKVTIGKELVADNLGSMELGYPNPTDELDGLFEIFYHSVPSERTDKKERKSYFKGLPLNELSDEDMLYGEQRESARTELELCVLAAITNGSLTFGDGWFWQSANNPSFIILKEWTGNNQQS